jgi:TolA-binding protein
VSNPPTGTLGAPTPLLPTAPHTPELAMQEGSMALARRDYASAEAAARDVLKGSRTSPRTYDAMFLLAQAQYGQRQYSQAALSFDDTYNWARKGPYAEDALLGLANSLIGLNDKASACQALAKLAAEFPTLRADLREQINSARQHAGCRSQKSLCDGRIHRPSGDKGICGI